VCSCWLLSLRRAGICVGAHPGQKGQPALSGKAANNQLASQPVQALFELHACSLLLHCTVSGRQNYRCLHGVD